MRVCLGVNCPPTPALPFALAVWNSRSWDFSNVVNLRSAYVTSSLAISGKVTGEFKNLVAPTGETGTRFWLGSNKRWVSFGANRVIHVAVRRGFWLIVKDFMTKRCLGLFTWSRVPEQYLNLLRVQKCNGTWISHSSHFLEQMHRVIQFGDT